ncbi:hypothetical protein SAMN06272765_4484 [Streptomyces sp. Ag109_G2-15]|nr:hypothetical protein SAMN06272765_4484 [Streptomyces sp. Ag109_G2-15]
MESGGVPVVPTPELPEITNTDGCYIMSSGTRSPSASRGRIRQWMDEGSDRGQRRR